MFIMVSGDCAAAIWRASAAAWLCRVVVGAGESSRAGVVVELVVAMRVWT